MTNKVALITGAAHRIGATVARTLHAQGMNIVIHYRSSRKGALALQKELQAQRPDSVILLQTDLLEIDKLTSQIGRAHV